MTRPVMAESVGADRYDIGTILTSPLFGAVETSEIFGRELRREPQTSPGLEPGFNPRTYRRTPGDIKTWRCRHHRPSTGYENVHFVFDLASARRHGCNGNVCDHVHPSAVERARHNCVGLHTGDSQRMSILS